MHQRSPRSQRVAESRVALEAWTRDIDSNTHFPGSSVCHSFVYQCAMWRHPRSGWVPAPGHAGRINKGKFGWELKRGANTFFVDLAISMYLKRIHSYLDQTDPDAPPSYNDLLEQLKFVAPLSVGNFQGERFSTGYPLHDHKLIFGTQAICNRSAVAIVAAAAELPANFGEGI